MKNFMQKCASLWLTGLLGRTGLMKLGLLALAGLLAGAAWAQPVNDNFTNATVILGFKGTFSGITNANASLESCESNTVPTDDHGVVGVTNSVWYSWTAPAGGTAVIDTIGSRFDTVLSVYSSPNHPADLCDPNLK